MSQHFVLMQARRSLVSNDHNFLLSLSIFVSDFERRSGREDDNSGFGVFFPSAICLFDKLRCAIYVAKHFAASAAVSTLKEPKLALGTVFTCTQKAGVCSLYVG